MPRKQEAQHLKEDENCAASFSLFNSNNIKRQLDPLTGKRLKVSVHNGFSSFREKANNGICSNDSSSEDDRAWEFQPRWLKNTSFYNQNTENAIENNKISLGKRARSISKGIGETQNNGVLSKIINTWKNPVFGVSKERQLEAQIDTAVQAKQNNFNLSTTKFTFTKENLANVDVIGQVDEKFIACTISNDNEVSKRTRTLIIVDQHAAHERIRLEALQDEYLQGLKQNDTGLSVDCKDMIPPLIFTLAVPCECSLRRIKCSFERIGIYYTVRRESVVDGKNYVELSLLAMPKLFIKSSETRGITTQRPILEESTIKDLFCDHINQYQETPIATSVIPPSINNVLCSYACHSAIRFGDKLTIQECNSIMKSLASCRLPFQCAHGRPSIAPLINMDKFS